MEIALGDSRGQWGCYRCDVDKWFSQSSTSLAWVKGISNGYLSVCENECTAEPIDRSSSDLAINSSASEACRAFGVADADIAQQKERD